MRTLRSKLRLHRVAFVVCAVFNFFSVGLENSWAQQLLGQLPAAGRGSIPFVMVSIPCGTKFDDLIEPYNGRESNAPDYKQIVPKKNASQLAAVLGLGAQVSIYPCPNPLDGTPPDRKLVVPLDLLSDQARANYEGSSFQQPALNVTGLLSDPRYGNKYVQFFQGLGIGTYREKLSSSTILVTVGATVGAAAGLALASPFVVTLSTAAGTIYLAGTAGRWVTEAIKALIEVRNKTPQEAYTYGKELADAGGFARELKTTLLGVGTGVLTGIATAPLRNAAASAAAAGPKVKTSSPKPAATHPTNTTPTPTTAGTQATEAAGAAGAAEAPSIQKPVLDKTVRRNLATARTYLQRFEIKVITQEPIPGKPGRYEPYPEYYRLSKLTVQCPQGFQAGNDFIFKFFTKVETARGQQTSKLVMTVEGSLGSTNAKVRASDAEYGLNFGAFNQGGFERVRVKVYDPRKSDLVEVHADYETAIGLVTSNTNHPGRLSKPLFEALDNYLAVILEGNPQLGVNYPLQVYPAP